MIQTLNEEAEIWDWLQGKNIPKLSEKTGIGKSRLYYFQSGKAENASFQLVRTLQILKEKEESK